MKEPTVEKLVEMAEALVVVRLLEAASCAGPATLSRDTHGGWEIKTKRPDGGETFGQGDTLQEAARNYVNALGWLIAESDRDPRHAPPHPGEVVHILHRGRALCQFSLRVPHEWEDGHTWISLHQHREGLMGDLGGGRMCDACIAKEDD